MSGAVRAVGAWLFGVASGLGLAGCVQTPESPARAQVPHQGQASITAPVTLGRPAPDQVLVTVARVDEAILLNTASELARDYGLELLAQWPLDSIDIHCYVFRMPEVDALDRLRGQLLGDARVDSVQPMQTFEVLGYDDAYLELQRGAADLEVIKAHRWSTGRGVRVGIVDTGIDTDHEDLMSRVSVAKNFTGDAAGDVVSEFHGTAIAGVIGAAANNRRGIVGVAPDATLLGLRGCWEGVGRARQTGRCSSFTLARAINFAILNDVDVINLSLRGPDDQLLARLIRRAVAENVVVVAPDDPVPGASFPGNMPEVLAVRPARRGGDGGAGARAETTASSGPSSRQPQIRAPGLDILTTTPQNRYDFVSGSSLATAHVTGLVALIRALAPEADRAQLLPLLLDSVDGGARGELDPGPRESTSGPAGEPNAAGSVNACQALARLLGQPCPV